MMPSGPRASMRQASPRQPTGSAADADIERFSDLLLKQMYSRQMNVTDFVKFMLSAAQSKSTDEHRVYQVTIRNLLAEQEFYSHYPEEELELTAEIFGQLCMCGLLPKGASDKLHSRAMDLRNNGENFRAGPLAKPLGGYAGCVFPRSHPAPMGPCSSPNGSEHSTSACSSSGTAGRGGESRFVGISNIRASGSQQGHNFHQSHDARGASRVGEALIPGNGMRGVLNDNPGNPWQWPQGPQQPLPPGLLQGPMAAAADAALLEAASGNKAKKHAKAASDAAPKSGGGSRIAFLASANTQAAQVASARALANQAACDPQFASVMAAQLARPFQPLQAVQVVQDAVQNAQGKGVQEQRKAGQCVPDQHRFRNQAQMVPTGEGPVLAPPNVVEQHRFRNQAQMVPGGEGPVLVPSNVDQHRFRNQAQMVPSGEGPVLAPPPVVAAAAQGQRQAGGRVAVTMPPPGTWVFGQAPRPQQAESSSGPATTEDMPAKGKGRAPAAARKSRQQKSNKNIGGQRTGPGRNHDHGKGQAQEKGQGRGQHARHARAKGSGRNDRAPDCFVDVHIESVVFRLAESDIEERDADDNNPGVLPDSEDEDIAAHRPWDPPVPACD